MADMLQFDYETILNDLTTKLQDRLGGTISGGSSIQRLLEIISEKLAQVVRYSEYLTRETKWSLAQNASSILTQLELFGYNPHRKVGAKGTIRVSTSPAFNTTYPYSISIPMFSRFSNGSLTFCTTEAATLTSSMPYIDIPIVQGTPLTESFRGDQINNFRYVINNNSIENSVYRLLASQSIVMTEVENFGDTLIRYNGQPYLSGDVSEGYEYKIRNINGFEGIELQFPSESSYDSATPFDFTYLITEGEGGNVVSTGVITIPLDNYMDSHGISIKLYCTNPTPVTGGSGYETIEDMRENAPYAFNRVDKIITRNDYLSAIKKIVGDSVFYLWTEQEFNDQLQQFFEAYDFINNSRVFICGISYDASTRVATPIGDDMIDTINTTLENTKGLTDYFVAQDPSVIKFYLTGEVFFTGSLIDYQTTKDRVSDLLINSYDVGHIAFFESIYHSDYISLFRDIPEIDHVDVDINIYEDLELTLEPNSSEGTDVYDRYDLRTKDIQHFSFSKSENSKYYVTLYDKKTRNLLYDVAEVSYDSESRFTWKVTATVPDGGMPIGADFFGWDSINDARKTPAVGMFGPLTITGRYKKIFLNDTIKFTSADDYPYGLVVRLVPLNRDAVLLFQPDILTLTDAESVLNVWETTDSNDHYNTTDSLVFTEV